MRQVIIPALQKRKQAQRGGLLAQVYQVVHGRSGLVALYSPEGCFPSFHSLAGRVSTRRSGKEAGAANRGLHGGYLLCLGHRGAKDSPGAESEEKAARTAARPGPARIQPHP